MNLPCLRPELRDYLMAGAPKSLLLIGDKHSKVKEDAMKVASFLLGTESVELSQDYMEVSLAEGEKSLRVEDAERIIERAQLTPLNAPKQVVVIDCFDLMTEPAQNKLLKLLEESETVTVIAVAYEDRALATVKSRLQVVRYTPLSMAQFKSYCEDSAIGDPVSLYFMTGGIAEDAEQAAQSGVYETFVKVSEACSKGLAGIFDVLSLLHMVKEKDRQAFYENHPEYAGKMMSLVTYQVLQADGVTEKTDRMLQLYNKEIGRVSSLSFTKDDFMNFFVQIV